jgi:type IV pilus assembly protein PilW
VANAQLGVRIGLDSIVRDIRMAGLDPVGTAGAGIEEATTTKLRFTEDNDVDGVIENENRERITYEYRTVDDKKNPKTLRLGLYEGTGSESWQVLIDNVGALSFTYLDANGTPTDTLAEIRTVEISMTCEGKDAQGQTLTRTLNTKVRCRNL